MSEKDYIEAYETLFNETGEEENRDYYDGEANEFRLPSEKFKEDELQELRLEDVDEEAMEAPGFEPNLDLQKKLKFLPPQREIFKEVAEPEEVYQSRVKIAEILKKMRFQVENKAVAMDLDTIDIISRMINNRFWYNIHYEPSIEIKINEIIENMF
jgi:hypothetical protein